MIAGRRDRDIVDTVLTESFISVGLFLHPRLGRSLVGSRAHTCTGGVDREAGCWLEPSDYGGIGFILILPITHLGVIVDQELSYAEHFTGPWLQWSLTGLTRSCFNNLRQLRGSPALIPFLEFLQLLSTATLAHAFIVNIA